MEEIDVPAERLGVLEAESVFVLSDLRIEIVLSVRKELPNAIGLP